MTRTIHYWLVSLLLVTALSCSQRVISPPEVPTGRIVHTFMLEASPPVIYAGDSTILRWSIEIADEVTIEEAPRSTGKLRTMGTFNATGSLQVTPAEDTTYVISCTGATGYSCVAKAVRIRVKRR